MFRHIGSALRASALTLASLLLTSGVTWAQGGHSGGMGHAGGIGHTYAGGLHFGSAGQAYSGGIGSGVLPGSGPGIFGQGGISVGSPYPSYGSGFGRGYGPSMTYGVYGGGYGLSGPLYGYGYSYGGGYPYYGGNSAPRGNYGYNLSSYLGGSSTLNSTQPLGNYAFYYPSAAQKQTPPRDNLAHLLCLVPQNAELWFNGTKTKQTGPQREFVSPALVDGKRYAYDITARWDENGKSVELKRTVRVTANTWQTVDFTRPESVADKKK